jgi:hypothetical protein
MSERHRRVRAADPQQLDRTLLGVPENLHRMRRRRPMRNDGHVDVPQLGQLAYVRRVVPIPEARQISVRAGLPRVLRGRLAIHLQHTRARPADHAAQQMQVVHRDRRRRPLDVGRFQVADPGHPIDAVRLHHALHLFEAGRVRRGVVLVHPALVQNLAQQAVHQRQIRARPDRQMDVGPPTGVVRGPLPPGPMTACPFP